MTKERTLGTSTDGQGRAQTDRGNRSNTDNFQPESVNVHARPCQPDPLSSACLAANAALSLINLVCYFLDCQVSRLAQDFENEGGFTERLYRVRSAKRKGPGRLKTSFPHYRKTCQMKWLKIWFGLRLFASNGSCDMAIRRLRAAGMIRTNPSG